MLTRFKALLHCEFFTCVFYFSRHFLAFFLRFEYQDVGIQNASDNVRNTQEKCEKNQKRKKVFPNYTIHSVKSRASCVFLVFLSYFSCVLAHKPYQNAKPMHSVILA